MVEPTNASGSVISKTTILVVIVIMLTSLLSVNIVVASPVYAGVQSAASPTEFELLNLTMDSESDVTDHIWRAHYNVVEMANGSVDWNYTLEVAELIASRNITGQFALGGFYPAHETMISFSVYVDSYGFNSATFQLLWNGVQIAVSSYQSFVRCYVSYYDAGGNIHSDYASSPTWGIDNLKWIDVELGWNPNRSYYYSFSGNGSTIWQGYSTYHQDYDFSDPGTPWPSAVILTWIPGSLADYDTNYSCYLDNVTQTISLETSAMYAAPSRSQYTGMGFDAPYNTSITNCLPVLEELGQRATWFFDDYFMYPYSDGWNESDLQRILEADQEFGIHTVSIDEYNLTNRGLLNTQFTYLYGLANGWDWDDCSIVWTSLSNDYDWPFNDYVYDNYESIGRKIWVHWYSNQGFWADRSGTNDFGFSSGCIERGIPYAGYNHKVGDSEAASGDALFADWYDQVNTSLAYDLNIVGLAEYWFRYSAPWYVDVSQTGAVYAVDYDNYHVWNDFEITLDLAYLGLTGDYVGIYDLTDGAVVPLSYGDDYVLFNATDAHDYAFPVSASSSTGVEMNISAYNVGTGAFTMTSTLDAEVSAVYTVTGLDDSLGYRVFMDGDVIATGTGSSFIFSAIGSGVFEVEVWHESSVSNLVVLTVNLVGIGIIVTIVGGFVMPYARALQNHKQIPTRVMYRDLMKVVVVIIVGVVLYQMLHEVAIG